MKESRAVPSRLLWIATKPPWPTNDGGRLLLHETIATLHAEGHEITLVAPVEAAARPAAEAALAAICVPRLVVCRSRSRFLSALAAGLSGRPWTTTHHVRRDVRRRVREELERQPHDLVVAEQLQALAQSAPATKAGVPRVLRAQNVESDLWRQAAAGSRGARRILLQREARRLAAAEKRALWSVARTVTLSRLDADRLVALAGGALPHEVIPPPFPLELPPAEQRLEGEPAVVLFGSAGWEPNRRAASRFGREIWPRVAAELPEARLHWFGGGAPSGPGVVAHASPTESRAAFAPGSVLVLPIDLASGVRMRILEAWARGVAVVATPEAASGLELADDRELAIATTPEQFASAVRRLVSELGLYDRRVAAGRERLASDHDPPMIARRWQDLAESVTRGKLRA